MPSPQDHKPSSLSTLFAAQWRLGGVALEVLAMNVHNQAVRPAFLHMRWVIVWQTHRAPLTIVDSTLRKFPRITSVVNSRQRVFLSKVRYSFLAEVSPS